VFRTGLGDPGVSKTVVSSVSAAWLVALAGTALAGPVEDYLQLQAAERLDLKCKVLKYVEHQFLVDAEIALLEQTAEWSWLKSGRFTQQQYGAWIDERHAEAQALVDATGGCTSAAEPYLNKARSEANALIAQGLMLALHFHNLPETDAYRQLLRADQKQAAAAYDVFLQQAWGANYQSFMGFQRERASALLPFQPTLTYGDSDPYDFGNMFRTDDEVEQLVEARRRSARAIDLVQFEVMAETNGWRVLPEHLEGGWIIPTLTRADATNPDDRLVVVQGPAAYGLDDYSGVYQQLLARAPDGTVKLMLFGEVAAQLGPTPGARFYIPSMLLPVGVDDWSYFNEPTFRDLAMAWDGTPMTGPCLGGPCFDFPPEVFDAIGRRGEQGQVELFIASDPATQPAPITPGQYRFGRIASRHFYTLMEKE